MIQGLKASPPLPTASWKRDAAALALLVVLVLPLRVWLVASTVVPARDCIGYIRYALEFEHLPWQDVWKMNDQHPGYALAVLAVSLPVRAMTGQTDAETMQFAAQLTSVLAALLLLYPMYHLGRLLFDRGVGFGAALLFQYLPLGGHHLSDGVSEAFFMLLIASALLQAVRAVQGRSVPRFALCGLLSGLGYLTRPEALLIPMATLLVLGAMQAGRIWRQSWRRSAASAAALLLLCAAVGSVYPCATERLTGHSSGLRIFQMILHPSRLLAEADLTRPGGRGPLLANTFKHSDQLTLQLARSTRSLALEVSNGFHFVAMVPLILGLAWSYARLRTLPGFWVLAVYCTMHAATLLALAFAVSYVSDRHVMVLVMCGSYLAVAGICELPRRVLNRVAGASQSVFAQPALWSVLLEVALIGFCLPKTLLPLHANRAGNRAAGLWLAEHLRPGDSVDDDHCWSHFVSGQVFLEDQFRDGRPLVVAPGHKPITYVVITRSRDPEINDTRTERERQLRESHATIEYAWPENGPVEGARVVVYALRP
jgi:hypothetical protein